MLIIENLGIIEKKGTYAQILPFQEKLSLIL